MDDDDFQEDVLIYTNAFWKLRLWMNERQFEHVNSFVSIIWYIFNDLVFICNAYEEFEDYGLLNDITFSKYQ